jgi:hypothetical protein
MCDAKDGGCRRQPLNHGIVVKLLTKPEQGWCLVFSEQRDRLTPRYPYSEEKTWMAYVKCNDLIHLPQDKPAY